MSGIITLMITSISKELKLQINREFLSAYQYLGMSTWCSLNGFAGCAHWFQLQAKEEFEHGMKIYNYLIERDVAPELFAIEAPTLNYKTLTDLFKHSLDQEQTIEAHLNGASVLALEEKDHVTLNFLGWFLEEQVEEIASVQDILEKLKLAEGNNAALLMIDQQLASRS